jgi:hypothetical protein
MKARRMRNRISTPAVEAHPLIGSGQASLLRAL